MSPRSSLIYPFYITKAIVSSFAAEYHAAYGVGGIAVIGGYGVDVDVHGAAGRRVAETVLNSLDVSAVAHHEYDLELYKQAKAGFGLGLGVYYHYCVAWEPKSIPKMDCFASSLQRYLPGLRIRTCGLAFRVGGA